jgi:ribosomal protein S18 acetylase RimI-like enzyme
VLSYNLLRAEGKQDKQRCMKLLLLADESEIKIEEYLYEGDLFYLEDSCQNKVGVIVLLRLDNQTIEIKNVAIVAEEQGKGLGKMLVTSTLQIYNRQGFGHYIVGTANSSIYNLAFYQKLGFRIFEIKKDFFLDYPVEILENGIRAMDMIMLEKREQF